VVGVALVAAIGLPMALRQAGGLSVSPSTGLSLLAGPANGGAIRRIYDPPAQPLTAYIVSLLAGDDRSRQVQPALPITAMPAATDRAQPESPSRARVASDVGSPPMRAVRS
jgi:hypothetical protein